MARLALPRKRERNLDQPKIARVQQPHGVEIHEEQASSRAPDRATQLPKKLEWPSRVSSRRRRAPVTPGPPKEARTATSAIRRRA